jgi:hypothetical protein
MNASPRDSNSTAIPIRPPQLIQSLVGGFHTVANNIGLILLPLALDLLLWFGPHLRVQKLFTPVLTDLIGFLRTNGAPEMKPAVDSLAENMGILLNRYNLFAALNTFPVGVPSQMAATAPLETPLGAPGVMEIDGLGQMLLLWAGLTLAGFLLGCLYFAVVARAAAATAATTITDSAGGTTTAGGPTAASPTAGGPTAGGPTAASPTATAGGTTAAGATVCPGEGAQPRPGTPAVTPRNLAWQALQILAMTVLLIIFFMVLMVPATLIGLLVALVSPVVAQFVMLMAFFGAVWLLVPLIFSPHGVFLCGQSVFNAILNSARVVRASLPGTGFFLLAVLVLNQGMNVLWYSAPETSWMALVGLFGHAFVSTALLAATFCYYHSGLRYFQALRSASARTA